MPSTSGPTARRIERPFKITVVGDGTVGKTCLLISYTNNRFPTDYIPTVFEEHRKVITVDGVDQQVTLWDTAGQEQYDRLRHLTYPRTDCFIVCYSVEKVSSFKNVWEKWYPELKTKCPNAVLILVGTKLDLKEGSPSAVSTKEGKKMKSKIKARKFVECSAQTRENLEAVFIEAVRAITMRNKKGINRCKVT